MVTQCVVFEGVCMDLLGLVICSVLCFRRCSNYKCNKRISLTHGHPIFRQHFELDTQTYALFARSVGVEQGKMPLLIGIKDKVSYYVIYDSIRINKNRWDWVGTN